MPGPITNAIKTLVLRELRALDREVAAYPDDESVWLAPPGAPNSAGNLALHLAGNLRHFVGTALGNGAYKRDRDAEFSTRGLSRDELRGVISAAVDDLSNAFDKMTDDDVMGEYPLLIAEQRLRTSDFLIHLAVHLSYHLGQIDYHRRLLTSSGASVDTMSIRELQQIVP